jgi:hypothetical protein
MGASYVEKLSVDVCSVIEARHRSEGHQEMTEFMSHSALYAVSGLDTGTPYHTIHLFAQNVWY